MRSYPIWLDVTSCIYKSSKSYGVKRDGNTNIYVGTNANNSHHFGKIRLTHRDLGEGVRSYRLYVDDEVIRLDVLQWTFSSCDPALETPSVYLSRYCLLPSTAGSSISGLLSVSHSPVATRGFHWFRYVRSFGRVEHALL